MSNATPETGDEATRSNAVATTTKLATFFPDNIEAILEANDLDNISQTAINYINAMATKLNQIPRANRNSWLQKNSEFLEWLTSFPKEVRN